jgi:hypothetical protein
MDYVGGDDCLLEIEMDKLSPQLKESTKFCFQIPQKEFADELVFLHDDSTCVKMLTAYVLVELLMYA